MLQISVCIIRYIFVVSSLEHDVSLREVHISISQLNLGVFLPYSCPGKAPTAALDRSKFASVPRIGSYSQDT